MFYVFFKSCTNYNDLLEKFGNDIFSFAVFAPTCCNNESYGCDVKKESSYRRGSRDETVAQQDVSREQRNTYTHAHAWMMRKKQRKTDAKSKGESSSREEGRLAPALTKVVQINNFFYFSAHCFFIFCAHSLTPICLPLHRGKRDMHMVRRVSSMEQKHLHPEKWDTKGKGFPGRKQKYYFFLITFLL